MMYDRLSVLKVRVAAALTTALAPLAIGIESSHSSAAVAAEPAAALLPELLSEKVSSAANTSEQYAQLPELEPEQASEQAPERQPSDSSQTLLDSLLASPEAQSTLIDDGNLEGGHLENDYILGAGDQVRIDAFGAPEYSAEALILSDGTLSLPIAGPISVGGLTLAAATDAIAVQYAPYLQNPQVTLTLIELRPVRVGVVGAVNRPGTYTISIESDDTTNFPTLTDALGLAGGISSQADIRQVEVLRQNQSGRGSTLSVNLWELLQRGDMGEDILLRSGDTVVVPVATTVNPAEAAQLGAASFSPDIVTVYVVGEVSRPGPVQVPPNTPLNQALLAAGGFDTQRANDDKVGLIRLNADGSVQQRAIAVNFNSGINEEDNPILREDDVVVVERSGLASFSDTVGLAVNPVGRLLNGVFNIFNLLD
ncbi:MAG: polysaccharide biosynthesis/export family protein [Cyanobacteria bacterium J06631_12]